MHFVIDDLVGIFLYSRETRRAAQALLHSIGGLIEILILFLMLSFGFALFGRKLFGKQSDESTFEKVKKRNHPHASSINFDSNFNITRYMNSLMQHICCSALRAFPASCTHLYVYLT